VDCGECPVEAVACGFLGCGVGRKARPGGHFAGFGVRDDRLGICGATKLWSGAVLTSLDYGGDLGQGCIEGRSVKGYRLAEQLVNGCALVEIHRHAQDDLLEGTAEGLGAKGRTLDQVLLGERIAVVVLTRPQREQAVEALELA
jgi:hypothetical protein